MAVPLGVWGIDIGQCALKALRVELMDGQVTATAFGNLPFTLDPISASLARAAQAAEDVGLLDPVDLTGIYDLTVLNELLEARGKPPIETP